MARAIAIMGESGSGKTTSMRNLDAANADDRSMASFVRQVLAEHFAKEAK